MCVTGTIVLFLRDKADQLLAGSVLAMLLFVDKDKDKTGLGSRGEGVGDSERGSTGAGGPVLRCSRDGDGWFAL